MLQLLSFPGFPQLIFDLGWPFLAPVLRSFRQEECSGLHDDASLTTSPAGDGDVTALSRCRGADVTCVPFEGEVHELPFHVWAFVGTTYAFKAELDLHRKGSR